MMLALTSQDYESCFERRVLAPPQLATILRFSYRVPGFFIEVYGLLWFCYRLIYQVSIVLTNARNHAGTVSKGKDSNLA